ncbi:MAG TPA: DUF1353 domain-containing protein [Ornithinimicrobium sp.]|uniref:DUF1353 domain-containing protein n=1 Tax=Ornithinimicrobium sp. TaxID=1977084 RepID=UPI002B480255|nr:DUF1353 domain-containing protein [Ornithinimicrobium sp.]HKJ12466.1 DUF1353 domain-containing protein [Ornithinimicrobium sp.]
MARFFDAADGGPLRLELRSLDGRDFTVLRRIGYDSDRHAEPFVVPADRETFATDLASVPRLLTWLVPRSGVFLPAAVLHDALTEPGQHLGPEVDRVEADRLFREAMIGLGTGTVRAWLMWSAVTATTMWLAPQLTRRVALVLTLGLVLVLGGLATLDLLDLWDVLPWMGQRPLVAELVWGAVFAVLVPWVLSLTWGRLWPAGTILGVALALLWHITAVLAGLYLTYLALERAVSGPAGARGEHARWSPPG